MTSRWPWRSVPARRRVPLEVDPVTGELISRAARFLNMSRKDFVAEASRAYLEQRQEGIRLAMLERMQPPDGSLITAVSLVTGLSRKRIEALGRAGVRED